jgi:hypothetical protein
LKYIVVHGSKIRLVQVYIAAVRIEHLSTNLQKKELQVVGQTLGGQLSQAT